MDSLIGVKGKDFIIMAADTNSPYSVMKLNNYEDKIIDIDGSKLLGIVGERSDILSFGDYVCKNLTFLQYSTGYKPSVDKTAQFIRSELAEAIRKGPYSVNCLLAGFEGDKPRLYWLDYLGSVVEINKAAHGYAENFVSSIMDTMETKDMDEKQGMEVIDKCLDSLRDRFLLTQSNFTVKIIRKTGVEIIRRPNLPEGYRE